MVAARCMRHAFTPLGNDSRDRFKSSPPAFLKCNTVIDTLPNPAGHASPAPPPAYPQPFLCMSALIAL
ncbi:hypothetical protein E2C01_011471 [Portunus trituberculatus]|uniref:Uncharacterized protein n=1 Tax=Portunus trituberculatus TaxID=210409 RepID=A0A5B7DBG7_PORTR|nr:hypothetical protein [Portunus trituberculatus]